MVDEVLTPVQKALIKLGTDRPLAHAVLFKHRHPQASPDFHREMILDWHSPQKSILDLVFRGGSKSTIAEEAIAIMALYSEFKNGLIVGSSLERATQRLHAIRNEFHTNEMIRKLFGDPVGEIDGANKIVTSRGIMLQALGRGQSLRGIKHLDARPDMIFADDIEERIDVVTPEARAKVFDWLTLDLIPACDPNYRIRMAATPLHPESTPMRMARDPEWLVHKYPIYYLDEEGERRSSWPERFPIEAIDRMEQSYVARGQLQGFRQEYMCESEAPETKPFKPEMMRVEPRVRTWQAVYSMTDPARTVNANAATTGHAVWSWIGPKLVIWDAWAKQLMPDQIIEALFQTDNDYHPVSIGVEADGLEQFLLQPIRQESIKRGHPLPLKALRAPQGKIDFIRGLQPFFGAREVEFAKPLPELQEQLLGFPTGRIDAPNALAYALKMRPGAPIYDDFSGRHVAEDLRPSNSMPVWLCLNATRGLLTGVALQVVDGCIRVFADVVREGDPATTLAGAVADMQLSVGANLRLTAGPLHFDRHNNVGLVQAAKKLPREVRVGVDPGRGRTQVASLLQRERHSMPMVMCGDEARWTLNGFVGGYSRALLKAGQLADYAEEGVYRTLMEGVESFVGLLEVGSPDSDYDDRSYATTADGRRYVTMLGKR